MKIISTNIAEPQTIIWNDKEVTTGIFKYSVESPIFLGDEDVVNDHVINRKYHGGVDKACYLYSADHYKYWQEIYPNMEMPWGMFGENLTVEGLHEAEVNIGDIFKLGETIVQATQPRQPCFKMEFRFHDKNIVHRFIDAGYPGVYVRVLQKGEVKAGDTMELIEKKNGLSIQNIYQLLYAEKYDPAVAKAVSDPFIAEACKKDLLKKWEKHL